MHNGYFEQCLLNILQKHIHLKWGWGCKVMFSPFSKNSVKYMLWIKSQRCLQKEWAVSYAMTPWIWKHLFWLLNYMYIKLNGINTQLQNDSNTITSMVPDLYYTEMHNYGYVMYSLWCVLNRYTKVEECNNLFCTLCIIRLCFPCLDTAKFSTVKYNTVHYTVLNSSVLYHTVLYCIVINSTILYSTVLTYSILYFSLL
jgi:hypothetical protein